MSNDDPVGFDQLDRVWRQADWADSNWADTAARVIQRAQELDRHIRRRDRLETLVAVLVLPVFIWVAAMSSHPLPRIGALLVALGCIVTPIRLRQARGSVPDPTLPLREGLRRELNRAQGRERLLGSVGGWYLGPLGVGSVLLALGSELSPGFRIGFTILVVTVNGTLYWLNRRALRAQLAPRIAQLQTLIDCQEELS